MVNPARDDTADETPLDPAVERVRGKLVRFMAINVALLLLALMAVLGAIVYKSASPENGADGADVRLPVADGTLDGTIPLPPGATIVSHSLVGTRLTLHARLADGNEAIFLYDIAERRIVGRFDVVDAGNP